MREAGQIIKMTRRSFLLRVSKASIFAAITPGLLSFKKTEHLQKDPWLTISKVQEHLLPSEDNFVGAKEMNALHYLKSNVTGEKLAFIKKGSSKINEVAKEQYGEYFVLLSEKKRERIIEKFTDTSFGEGWLSMLLSFIFEALLGDPVYGGNPEEKGWKSLEHQGGFPLPPKNKRFQNLLTM